MQALEKNQLKPTSNITTSVCGSFSLQWPIDQYMDWINVCRIVISSLYLSVWSVLHLQRLADPTSIDVSFIVSSLKGWAIMETMD